MTLYQLPKCGSVCIKHMQQQGRKSRRRNTAPIKYAEPKDVDLETIARRQRREQEEARAMEDRKSVFEHRHWGLREKLRWFLFMERYQDVVDWNSERKSNYMYKHMSVFMKNRRTPEQCKNAHSLLKRKFYDTPLILIAVEKEVTQEDDFYRLSQKYQADLQTFHEKEMAKNFDEVQEEFLEARRLKRAEQGPPAKVDPPAESEQPQDENEEAESERAPKTEEEQLIELANYHFVEWLKHTQAYQVLQEPIQRNR